ncbi:MAG TPA: hypothetical protein VMV12_07540 [Candidatus Micrarchaeaceae archaeon]|nr:hypothetical protein [Candidatus Micrarchaeaceae archaeon]
MSTSEEQLRIGVDDDFSVHVVTTHGGRPAEAVGARASTELGMVNPRPVAEPQFPSRRT